MTGTAAHVGREQDDLEEVVYDDFISVDQYLTIEEASPVRHEYVDGVLYAMVGASKRHTEIVGNLYNAIRPHARERGCRVFFVEVKLQVSPSRIYYPDLMVVCDPSDTDDLIATRPCLLVEVRSPSTAAVDRREKASAYRQIESLESYLIVHQDQERIEHYYRDDERAWHIELLTDGTVTLRCPDMQLDVATIYDGIFDAE